MSNSPKGSCRGIADLLAFGLPPGVSRGGTARVLDDRPEPIDTNSFDIVGLDEHGAFNRLSGLPGSCP